MSERLAKIAEYIAKLDPLKSLFWAVMVGTAIASYSYAGIQNHLGNLDDSNTLRKTENITLSKRFDDLQKDREENIKEARDWREQTSRQIGRIQGILEAHFGEAKQQ